MARGIRRRGREAALQLLYQLDITDDCSPEAREVFWSSRPDRSGTEEIRSFADQAVDIVMSRRDEIDATLEGASQHWGLARMSRIDHNLLRLAAGELLYSQDVACEIVINEALEIARRFSDGKSVSFINGVLDRVATDSRSQD